MNTLLGVVLCGGQSKRMGSDKGLLNTNGKPWAIMVANKLEELDLPVALSINPTQQESYEAIFPNGTLIVDNLEIEGPLEGLLTVHKNFPDKDLLLMACDLIDMDNSTLQGLLNVYSSEPGYDYYVYDQDGFAQTFCAIYTSKALKEVFRKFENKAFKKYSLHDRFLEGKTKLIPLLDSTPFNNYNNLH
ncbi:molybdenum cofactor guanylyltransferase [Pedobacter sp. SYSU D00535]|uniref:molybdenum cofactor guanylyltransferase n=1 Tax=Pedobacter sp. SYSU D00535 TaxID=2810308 RepID=UPI001A96DC70|nr:molybdenum cofactor guanylyltransferase [Pedobacter sp. SYSU D00535]